MKKEFTVEQLIHDQSFRRFINGIANKKEIRNWNEWIEANERNRSAARDAIAKIKGFEFDVPQCPDVNKEWQKLKQETVDKKTLKVPGSIYHKKTPTVHWIYRIAAVFILGATVGLGLYIQSLGVRTFVQEEQYIEEQTVETNSGEQRTIHFNNGSKIVLNSNSRVTYSIQNDPFQSIIIVMEGEAYFDAVKQPENNNPVFAIQTPDGIIKDIGTEFLVTIEEDRSRVVLQEGKVKINNGKQKETDQEVMISAGQMIEFNRSEVLNHRFVNTTFYTSWATGSMKFDQTTIKEFANFLEQRFKVEVRIKDPAMAGIKIDGGIYFRSFEELVRSVSDVANVPVYQSENKETIYIGEFTSN